MYKKKITVFTLTSCILLAFFMTSCTNNANTNDSKKMTGSDNHKIFLDVKESDWYYPNIEYVRDKGLMQGTSDTTFTPEAPTTRGMLVTVLWRLDGEPIGNKPAFSDISDDAYYYNAIAWASQNGIVSGYSENTFAPNDNITREQLAAVLYRYSEYKNYDTSQEAELSKYKDASLISDYAIQAMQWANSNQIITGTSEDMLEPGGYALRGQIAAILNRFCSTFIQAQSTDESQYIATSLPSGNENDKTTMNPVSNGTDNENDKATGGVGNSSQSGMASDVSQSQDNSNTPLITIEEVSAKPGDEISIDIRIDHNPGVLGMALTAHFDETQLKLLNVETGEVFKDVLDFTSSKELGDGVKFLWDGIDIADSDIKDGVILNMQFKVNDYAKAGKYPITIEYFDGDIVDKNLASITPEIINGYITIVK